MNAHDRDPGDREAAFAIKTASLLRDGNVNN
jgi:hypothetical protein